MLRRIVCASVLAASALTPLACNPAGVVEAKGGSQPAAQRNNQNPDIGAPLFPPLKGGQKPAPASQHTIDPVIIPAHLSIIDKVDIPSQRDGKILFIATEDTSGALLPPDLTYRHPDADTSQMRTYRRLEAGDPVVKDSLVVMLDDQEALAEYRIRKAAVNSATHTVKAADATLKITKNVLQKTEQAFRDKVVSELELQKATLEVERADAELSEKKALEVKAVEELGRSKVQLEMHHIRSPITGILQPTNRKPGEAVRAQETVFQIQSTARLRADGTLPISFQSFVAQGMEVLIEPSLEAAPVKRVWPHLSPITGIAVSNHAKPLIVTVSEDKTARAWTLEGNPPTLVRECKHDVAVRCVACSPVNAKITAHLCLTGADDGKGRIWDLDAKDAPPRVLEEFKHKEVISAVAFAPDGKTCVTADSRDICLWDVAAGTKKYEFPRHHLGEITSLTFTPQTKLVSASRDNSIAVWSLGEKNASLDFVLDGRSGDVSRVGVSHNGQYVLFDIAQSLRVIEVPEKKTVAVMESITDAYKFASFAYYSPDDKLILTGTNTESRLSVWRAPTSAGDRAAELRQFIPSNRVSFTCAAISPTQAAISPNSPNEKLPFAVTGTKEGIVYVWPMPTEKETQTPIRGVIKFVDKTTDATSRQIRVWAEFKNDIAQLAPGGAVTLVVNQQQAVAPKR